MIEWCVWCKGFRCADRSLLTAEWCVMQMVLKCADIGHLTAAPKTHKRWAVQLEEEFFRQASPPVADQHSHESCVMLLLVQLLVVVS